MSAREGGTSWLVGWRGALLWSTCALALLGAFEIGAQTYWRMHLSATSFDQELYPNGRVAHMYMAEERWLGGVLELWFRPDGTIDRERSFRSRYGVHRAIPEEEIREVETNAWWGELDGEAIAWHAGRHFEATGSLPKHLEEVASSTTRGPTRIPPDRWGRAYVYTPPADGALARITTFGHDGVPGGKGDDEDWIGELGPDGEPTFDWSGRMLEP